MSAPVLSDEEKAAIAYHTWVEANALEEGLGQFAEQSINSEVSGILFTFATAARRIRDQIGRLPGGDRWGIPMHERRVD